MHPVSQVVRDPVSPRLAHRTDEDGVLVSSAGLTDDGHIVFSSLAPPRPDALLMCEAFRQAAYVACHTHAGVPLDRVFLLDHVAFGVHGASADEVSDRAREGFSAVEVIVRRIDIPRPSSHATHVHVEGEITAPGGFLARLSMAGRILVPAVYGRMRRAPLSAPRPVTMAPAPPPVISSSQTAPGTWGLVVDTSHPLHFDHPLDHAPGSLLIDAARAAMRARLGDPRAEPLALNATFSRFVELSRPAAVGLHDEGTSLVAAIRQDGHECARIALVPAGAHR